MPYEARAWTLVGPGKISSWTLLIVISFIIVAVLKRGRSLTVIARSATTRQSGNLAGG